MNIITTIFRAIFGDRVAERTGKAFLKYFGGEECPPEVRQDIELGLIYYDAKLERAENVDEMLAAKRAQLNLLGKKQEAGQK